MEETVPREILQFLLICTICTKQTGLVRDLPELSPSQFSEGSPKSISEHQKEDDPVKLAGVSQLTEQNSLTCYAKHKETVNLALCFPYQHNVITTENDN